ncbi:MAG: hypothetical protein KDC53_01130, partial [Saprospiraceae bacterium]|nr:hypothetical protein [Saprospiraceae bacterium]
MKLLQYLFDCTIIWFILFLIYHLLLRGETFFRMNRLYLISSLFFGLTLPFIRFINIHFGSAETIDNMLYPVSNALYLSPVYTESLTSDQSAKHLVIVFILLIYLSGVIYFSLSLFRGLRKIYMLYCNG